MCDEHTQMYVRRHICHARVLSRFNHVQLRVLYGLQSTRPLCPQGSPGKDTGVGGHALLQGTEPMSLTSPTLAGGFFTTLYTNNITQL